MASTKRPIQELFPLMYNELRRVAGRYLGRERSNHTLQPTALVNEAWLRLQSDRAAALPGRTQGLALAAQAMRRVLVDHGRHQKSHKRGVGEIHLIGDDVKMPLVGEPERDLVGTEGNRIGITTCHITGHININSALLSSENQSTTQSDGCSSGWGR